MGKRRAAALGAAFLCACVSFAKAADDTASAASPNPASIPSPTRAAFDAGVKAYDAGDYVGAYRIFSSIDDTDLAAMRNVAFMLRRGQGTAKDPKAAEEIYLRAAQDGFPNAQADLGEMLMNGEAGPPDPVGAVPWLTAAAAAHHPVAEFELGELFETGQGVRKDIEVARHLYTEAAARDVPGAKERLAALPPPPAGASRDSSPPAP